MKSIIFHIDVNSAFLSWEAVYRLAHKGGKQDFMEIASAVAWFLNSGVLYSATSTPTCSFTSCLRIVLQVSLKFGSSVYIGADIFFECVGRNETVLQAVEMSALAGRSAWTGWQRSG